ncbi:aspartic proteinase PCS1-like [Gastrolobium bilobum]|uniref:aspartic proteinase PCS1-like n=1 Tax=Gastrolobium bilobum TaxID=150636 RepID=UPI002AB06E01|nr:aspartic proteinase PCS1-like [Gastrolobium bilobum]
MRPQTSYTNHTISTNPYLKLLILLILQTTLDINQINHYYSEAKMLALPLKSQVIPSGYLPRPPNKLRFHHNVSLTVSITVGKPPQNVSMVIDTGSELSWLHCNNTTTTTNSTTAPISRVLPDPFFNPTRSSTFSPISCSSPTCTIRTRDFPIPASCDSNNLCHATLSYADSSSSEGELASDTFGFGGSDNPGIVFGCMNSSYSSNSDEDTNTTGLMGMNLGSLSLISQLKIPKFSYCISGSDFSGILILGGSNFSWVGSLNYTPLVQISTPLPYFDRAAYTVRLKGIKVSNKLLNISGTIFVPDHTGSGQTMFDLGTQFTFLLGPVYSALRGEFLSQTNNTLRVLDDPNFVFQIAIDLCYRVPMNQSKLPELPSVSLVFEGAEMRVSGEQLLYRVPGQIRGNDSVYCFTFGNSDLLGVEAFIIGHYQQQNMWVEFDVVKSRVGLAHAHCDLVGQRVLGLR